MKKLLLAASLLLAGIQANAQKQFLHIRNSTGTAAFEVSVGGDDRALPCRGPICSILPTPVPVGIYYNVNALTDFGCVMTPPVTFQYVTHLDIFLMVGGFPVASASFPICGVPVSGTYPITFTGGYGTYNLVIGVGATDYTVDIM